MRILVLGAGGTGGYFGGRLAQGGADVTFLVREGRAAQLARDGLRLRSPLGDADLAVPFATASGLPGLARAQPFDLVVLSCKAYDLESAMDAVAPAVEAGAAVLPILNGLRHYPVLDRRFGAADVIGGLCFISATKGVDGEVVHLGGPASITFGERGGDGGSPRTRAFARSCARAGIDHVHSGDIAGEQWIKFAFLCTAAAATCLMRAPIGRIVAAEGGEAFIRGAYDEALQVAAAAGHAVPAPRRDEALAFLTRPGSPMTASMLRDLEGGQPVEAEHIVGDMVHRAEAAGIDCPRLRVAWLHLQAYELGRRARAPG